MLPLMMTRQKSILLTTLNARYTHSSIGLRYLYANMRELKKECAIREFTINDNIQDVAEQLLHEKPAIIGIGVYIWNAESCARLVRTIKAVAPHTTIILGGPEVSYSPLRVNFDAADFIIKGEADTAFYDLCQTILQGSPPQQNIIQATMADLGRIELPYDDYNDEDVANRYIYVEASRGCPFSCEFCLSSIDKKVRNIDIDKLLHALETLYQRGVRSFKFIDRTFNLNITIAARLLDFFLAHQPCFVHFEVIPDHFPDALKERIARFPAAALQLEIGIQTLNPEVANRIHRNLKLDKIEKNIRFLEKQTSAHMHLDLIVGLPGETLASFGHNLNRLTAMTTAEIQIGILKKLSGTSLHRHDSEFGMVYADVPPYDILNNHQLSFKEIQNMKRFARFWDLYYNSGNFKQSIRLLWPAGDVFEQFYACTAWIYEQTRSTWKISLERLAELLFTYLTEHIGISPASAAETLIADIMTLEGRKMPPFLKPFAQQKGTAKQITANSYNKRQIRHTSP